MPNSRMTSPFGPRACPLASCCGMPFLMMQEGVYLAGSDPYFHDPTDMKITYARVGKIDKLYDSNGNYIVAQLTEALYSEFEFHEAQGHSLLVKTGDVVRRENRWANRVLPAIPAASTSTSRPTTRKLQVSTAQQSTTAIPMTRYRSFDSKK
ncbi:hypothetical protein CQ012_12480 [Arthrobacter sp. MYb214]|nr:hypothetical protein CQ012_12480 [Arthrobacter sp. MYb214]